jgi:AraC-like DNA-binding protein
LASLAQLSRGAGVSAHHLQRRFKRLVGLTPRQYAEARRLEALKGRLKKGELVTTALFESGFGSSSRLYESSSSRLGMTPATYRRGGRGASMAFSVVASPFGRLLVAATERGVSMVALGDSRPAGDGVPVARLARAAGDSRGHDAELRRGRAPRRAATGRAGGGPGLREQPGRARDPLPSRGAGRRRQRRISLGQRTQARAAAARSRNARPQPLALP